MGLCTVIASNGLIARCTENSRGGIYGILTYVFGGKVGATVGIMYVLGQVSIIIKQNFWVILLLLLRCLIFNATKLVELGQEIS